jgi:cytoskeletal protein RodZ
MVRIKAKKTQTPADTIGGKLRKAREEKGISIEEVHKTTKIHPSVLEAIEEDRLENILERAYVKAFLKNYANYLGLEANEIVNTYISRHVPKAVDRPQPILKPRPVLQIKPKNLSYTIIITLAFILWIFILGIATVKFIRYNKEAVKKREIIATVKPNEPARLNKSKEIIPIPKGRTITLTVVTSRDVWVKVTQDGELAFHGILSKGSEETWRADREILLSEIGRPEALNLDVNGKNIDLSERRLGKNILITHKGMDLEPKL